MDKNGMVIKGIEKIETRPAVLPDGGEPGPAVGALLPPLFIELAHRVKNTLSSIRNLTLLSRGKFKDLEFEAYFHRSTTEDITKIESIINGLLHYVKVSNPRIKSNTVHSLIQEVVGRLHDQITQRKIRLVNKFEKGLPETIVHEEQLRYVFHSLLQYAIASTPSNGSIGILTRQAELPKPGSDRKGMSQRDGCYVEVLIGMTGYKKNRTALNAGMLPSSFPRDETMELVLRLVKEIVNKNRGALRFDVDERKGRTYLSVVLPVERRKIVYYPKTDS